MENIVGLLAKMYGTGNEPRFLSVPNISIGSEQNSSACRATVLNVNAIENP